MNTESGNSVQQVCAAQAALTSLCRPFAPHGFAADCEVIRASEIPAPSGALLGHENHMTIELQRHHGRPVEVNVLKECLEDDVYTRKISLTLAGTSRVVEWGIARLHLRHLSPEVRNEVLAKRKPLGAILIAHQVHRRIEPRHFVRFPADSPVLQLFNDGFHPQPVYGRLGIIYCHDEPAIELLEIVVNTEVNQNP